MVPESAVTKRTSRRSPPSPRRDGLQDFPPSDVCNSNPRSPTAHPSRSLRNATELKRARPNCHCQLWPASLVRNKAPSGVTPQPSFLVEKAIARKRSLSLVSTGVHARPPSPVLHKRDAVSVAHPVRVSIKESWSSGTGGPGVMGVSALSGDKREE